MTAELTAPRPGRWGDPDLHLGTDPRFDPRLVAALAPLGLAGPPPVLPVGPDAPREHVLEACAAAEAAFEGLFGALGDGLPPVPGVRRETVTIPAPGGHEITLFVHRPDGASGPLPGIVHVHGGGMVILRADSPPYHRWRDELAASGLVVVGVEFRNGGGALGAYPYPAGQDDCVTATRWVLDQAGELGIDRVVVSGESGGGNLSLGVALRAKREGWVDRLAGVYAQCPYISGAYADPPPELGSLWENDGYLIGQGVMSLLVAAYDPDGAHRSDPLAWPLRATADDLAGLPPHAISVNECDPLRDEGLAYLRMLLAAGVSAVGRVVPGTCHGGDILLPAALPDVHAASVRDVRGFAHALPHRAG